MTDLSFETWVPADINLQKLLTKARDDISNEKCLIAKQKHAGDEDFVGRFILYRREANAGMAFAKYLEAIGCQDIKFTDKPQTIFHRLRAGKVKMLILWYDRERSDCVDFLRQYYEARELENVAIMILCASAEIAEHFKVAIPDLPVDYIANLPLSRAALGREVSNAVKASLKDERIISSLNRLRTPWRNQLSSLPVNLDESQFKKDLTALSKVGKYQFWIQTEAMAYQLLTGANDQAKKMADVIRAGYPPSTLVLKMESTIQARLSGVDQAAIDLLANLKNLEKANEEDYFQIGEQLLRWRKVDALGEVLDLWYNDKKSDNNHQLCFLIASYYDQKGIPDKCRNYIKFALHAEPLRAEYWELLANGLILSKDYAGAEEVLNLAAELPTHSEFKVQIALLRCLYGQRKIRLADGLLNKLLLEYPADRQLTKIKKQYVESRVA